MFEQLKNMAGMAGIMRDLPKIKARIKQVQEELGRVTVEAQTGGGAVRACANGKMQITRIQIDQPMMSALVDASNAEDRAMAEDLVVGAVNAALEKAKERAQQELANAARELNLPIPEGSGLLESLG